MNAADDRQLEAEANKHNNIPLEIERYREI
jgi:hypothetical protein